MPGGLQTGPGTRARPVRLQSCLHRWLFIAGVSADVVGAIVIAAAVLSRTAAETREEASWR
jgi:hypothetical protein